VNDYPVDIPPLAARAQARAEEVDFHLSCNHQTGALLRTLAASKPGGRILEVGTGVGVGAAWLLAGMDAEAGLVTIEIHPEAADISREMLGDDDRADVISADAVDWLTAYNGPPFDLIFVDTTILKFERRDLLVANLAPGGLFVADDLRPQEAWTERHHALVPQFLREIVMEPNLVVTLMDWASGVTVAARRS